MALPSARGERTADAASRRCRRRRAVSHGRDENDLGQLAACAYTLIVTAQPWIEADRGERRYPQGRAQPSVPDPRKAGPIPGLLAALPQGWRRRRRPERRHYES